MKLEMVKENLNCIVDGLAPELTKIRHQLHQIPELGRQEKETTAFIIKCLENLNLTLTTKPNGTGLWADSVANPGQPFLALRERYRCLADDGTESRALRFRTSGIDARLRPRFAHDGAYRRGHGV